MTRPTNTSVAGPARVAARATPGRLGLAVLTASLALTLLSPSMALAVFTRPFVRQVIGTPTGLGGATVAFNSENMGGIAVDSAGDLWVARRTGSDELDEFNSLGEFIGPELGPEPLALTGSAEPLHGQTAPESLSINDSTGDFYITGGTAGGLEPHVEAFTSVGSFSASGSLSSEALNEPHVVVDGTTGSVYVASEDHGSFSTGIAKFNASGEPETFSGTAPYIKGNEISGTPVEPFSGRDKSLGLPLRIVSIALDSQGDIYVAVEAVENSGNPNSVTAVDEFGPNGVFVRSFAGGETPGLGGSREPGQGFGGNIKGLAIDPVSGHVLVAITVELNGNLLGAIDEFEASTGRFVDQITEASPGVPLSRVFSMAVDSSGDVYLVEGVGKEPRGYNDVIDTWGPGHYFPSEELNEASGREPTSAVLSGSVNPETLGLDACYFEVVPQSQFEASGFELATPEEKDHPCVPAAGAVPQDEAFHHVEADVTGLQSGMTYRFRMVASTEGVTGGTSESESLQFTAPHAPRIDASSVANISSRFADLHAEIDPLGAATSYRFEYSADGVTWADAPVPDAAIGSGGPSGDVDADVAQTIGPLSPDTTYTFRLRATSEIEGRLEMTVSPEGAFKTLPMTPEGLPDGRAYELVTPSNKGSAQDLFSEPQLELNRFENNVVGYPSESGEEFMLEAGYSAFGSFAASGDNVYVMRRGLDGWQTVPLASPLLGVQTLQNPIFGPRDFSRVAFYDNVGSDGSVGGEHHLNLLGPAGGPYTELHSEATGTIEKEPTEIVGSSHDLSRLVLASANHALVAGEEVKGPAESDALYEYSDGEFTLLDVNPKNEPFQCGATLGQVEGKGGSHNAVSDDGSKVFFTAPEPLTETNSKLVGPGCWKPEVKPQVNPPQLYVRSGGATTKVSAPEAGWTPEGEVTPALYVGASEDGSKVFFVTGTELTRDDAHIHDLELYEYDTETATLTRVSAGEAGSAGRTSGAEVYTVPAVSADGSAVYFTAFGALAPGAPDLQPATFPGPVNLYRYDTNTGVTVYVATVDTRDYPAPFVPRGWWGGTLEPASPVGYSAETALSPEANWYTTSDGRYLVFAATSAVTSYSTIEASHSGPAYCPEESGQSHYGHCREVYRYDSESPVSEDKPGVVDNPLCISCDPSGAAPVSDAYFAQGAGGTSPMAGSVRAISDNGSYAFFDSADPLVTQADNHTQDVYEWEASGAGGCELAQGCLRLINSGDDPTPSYFLGMSSYLAPDGETVEAGNVFFGTHAKLVAQDTDQAGDLYDARIGGGFAVGAGKGPCEGNACENPSAAPIDASPGSLTFSGAVSAANEAAATIAPKRKATLTTEQKLASALKACRKDKPKRKRVSCERRARAKYVKSTKAKKTDRKGK